ncbi:MAG: hypothetical protein U1D30_02915 [Planctomycetota bacterium]
MNDRFFEDLAQGDMARRPRPQTPEEQAVLDDLQPALALLDRGAPVNGINLVPFWTQKIEEELQQRPAMSEATRTRPAGNGFLTTWRVYASYAAVLIVGLALGTTASLGWDATSRKSLAKDPSVHAAVPVPHYTEEQQQWMFRVLDRLHRPSHATLQLAAAELAVCMNCHESALRHRFATAQP